MARAPATVAQAQADWPSTPIFGSLAEMIDSGVDAVTISTPPATRRELVLEAVGAGDPCYCRQAVRAECGGSA